MRNKSTKPKPVRNQYDEEVAIDAVDNPADPAAKTKKFFRGGGVGGGSTPPEESSIPLFASCKISFQEMVFSGSEGLDF